MDWNVRKREGVHYTPLNFAHFVANVTFKAWQLHSERRTLSILDPAVGDAGLLEAILNAATTNLQIKPVLTGFDTSMDAITFGKCNDNVPVPFR